VSTLANPGSKWPAVVSGGGTMSTHLGNGAGFDIDAVSRAFGLLEICAGIDGRTSRAPAPAVLGDPYDDTCRTSRATRSSISESLLADAAIDDPDVAPVFWRCWVYEESSTGWRSSVLAAPAHPLAPRTGRRNGHESPAQWLETPVTALLSGAVARLLRRAHDLGRKSTS